MNLGERTTHPYSDEYEEEQEPEQAYTDTEKDPLILWGYTKLPSTILPESEENVKEGTTNAA